MRRAKPRSLPPLLVLAGLLLAGCGGSSDPNTITLYSGQHEQTTALLVKAFEKQSGVKVQIRSADEATLGNQIVQEGPSSPADVFYAENTPVLENLREQGLLAPVAPATLAAIPSRYDSAQGDWVGVSARVSALVYNTSKLNAAEVPTSLLALAQPRWRAKVGFAPSETDFQPLVTAVIKLDGKSAAESWLKSLQAGAHLYPDNETVVTQVNNGQVQLGPVDHYYWYRLRREQGAGGTHSALGYYAAGDPGDLIDVSGAAVLRSSAKKPAAQKLLAFLVSKSGQQVIAHSQSWEYPLAPGVGPAPGLPPLASFHATALTPAELGDGHEALAMEQRLGLL
jgi:iron(III) transport system substrate-binding protein